MLARSVNYKSDTEDLKSNQIEILELKIQWSKLRTQVLNSGQV